MTSYLLNLVITKSKEVSGRERKMQTAKRERQTRGQYNIPERSYGTEKTITTYYCF